MKSSINNLANTITDNNNEIREILFNAIAENNVELFSKTINDFAYNINRRSNNIQNKNHIEAVQQLLNTPDELGSTMLGRATRMGHDKIIKILSIYKVHMNQEESLLNAIYQKDLNLLKETISHFNLRDDVDLSDNITAAIKCDLTSELLREASKAGYANIVKILVRNGASLYGEDPFSGDYGHSLHLAISHAQLEVITTLIKLGADVSMEGECSVNPLELAISKNNADVIAKLIELGVAIRFIRFPDIRGKMSSTNVESGDDEVIKLLKWAKLTDKIFNMKDLTTGDISKVLPASEAASFIKINSEAQKMLSQRIAGKFWINNLNDIKLQQAHFDVKDVQEIIINNLAKFNKNIAVIKDTYNIDLSFLKNYLDSFSNPDSIIHDNGTITLSNLALMKLAEQKIGFEKIVETPDLAYKALNLYELFKDVGISKLLKLSNFVAKKSITATSVTANIDMTQYVEDSEGLDNFSHAQAISADDLKLMAEAGAGSSLQNVD